MSTLTQDCKELEELRAEKKRLKEELDEAEQAFKTAERKLMERMAAEEAESHRAGGMNFTPATTAYGKIDDREAFLEWARQQEGDGADGETLYEVKERKALINELVRERLDNDEPLPPGVGVYVREYVSVTAS